MRKVFLCMYEYIFYYRIGVWIIFELVEVMSFVLGIRKEVLRSEKLVRV